ncbi:dystrobrevin beta [Trichonephila clavipes]|nr:dystrobrevin beta [Trichonephila clavipes]
MDRNHHYKEKKHHSSQAPRADYHYLMAEMMHLVDIWNIIEAFRENGLNALDSRLELTVPRLETLVHSICYQLNKRLPLSQQIDVEYSSAVLVNWLLATYDPKFVDFLREAMGLPCSVYESPSFYFTESLPRTIFDGKTPSKQLGHSLKKSILCVPDKPSESHYQDEQPRSTKPYQALSSSPSNAYNGTIDTTNNHQMKSSLKSSHRRSSSDFYPREDEHASFSHYNNHLYVNRRGRYSSELNLPSDTARQRELIAKLEAKNREIMREIIRLRKQQEEEDEALRSDRNPTLLTELRALRMRKADLERHLSSLQESRRDLVLQLDVLMRMLKDHSPLSSPNSSPLSLISRSPIPIYPLSSMSAPTTPGSGPYYDPLFGLGGDVRLAFGQATSTRSLQSDLLVAADSVTNAMSSLVQQLNIGCDDDDIQYSGGNSNYISDLDPEVDPAYAEEQWPVYVDSSNYQSAYSNSYLLENPVRENGVLIKPDVYADDMALAASECFDHSDDNLEWEEGMRRWVNR